MVYRLSTSLWLPRPRAEVFAFFADARNLERITPALLGFRILTPAPIAMHTGAIIDYRVRVRRVPVRWRTEITVWDPPYRFTDVQRRGPYRLWEHTHAFEDADGGTMVRDEVRYALPGPGVVAALVHTWLVARDLRQIFAYRHDALIDAFGARGVARPGAVTLRPDGA